MENWKEKIPYMVIKWFHEPVLSVEDELIKFISSELELAKQEERERIKKVVTENLKEYQNSCTHSKWRKGLCKHDIVGHRIAIIFTSLHQNSNGRCNQCKLENNTGVCDRKDCSNHQNSNKGSE